MRSLLLSVSVLVVTSPASAQDFSGTWTLSGGAVPVTLTLQQDTAGRIAGTLTGQVAFLVQAQVTGQQFQGYARNPQGALYIAGQLGPAGALQLVMAEVNAAGQPQPQTARQVVAQRAQGGPGPTAGPGMGQLGMGAAPVQPVAPPQGSMPGMGGGSAIAATPQDQQIAQLMLRSPWCSFSYNQTTGTTNTERVVYQPDGTGYLSSGAETYNSGRSGTVAGQHQGGTPFRWRLQNGVLLATTDGIQWGQFPLQISANSNGYPIVKADGKEYTMCN
ncbi:MAG: hypothetical protein HY700_07015 [Gemmatimonadetes bacterium]|nr:hypothetical protein [Gemmatimonadota bacterium]